MREVWFLGKNRYSSHTFFIYPPTLGNWLALKQKDMKDMAYEIPQVEIIEVEIEKGFAGSDGGETPDYDI